MRTAHVSMFVAVLVCAGFASGQTADPKRDAHQKFTIAQGLKLREGDRAASNSEECKQIRSALRSNLVRAWGGFPDERCPLDAKTLGSFQRDSYRVERVIFQTLPGVWMTSNLYVPEAGRADTRTTRRPAVLCVHGHWSGAKQDPVVQSRCIGLAKLGFVVLCVDAFGAGERAIAKTLGEYHGEMTGAMLLPIGRPLSGIQVWENMRAVDYLQSRPEVNPDQIGITGASGGGNQTMYAGGFDERFRCVVPTCSVGTYQSYLRAACCMCEVVPGALQFTEEGDVLGLAADRGLMVTSATQDAFQFSVDQAKQSFVRVSAIAGLFDGARVQHTIIESPHHYNQPMREAMYGWMTLHLKGEGDGGPIAEPPIQTEEPETLRCFPGDSRPDDYMTIPRFAFREAQSLMAARSPRDAQTIADIIDGRQTNEKAAAVAREQLVRSLGGMPPEGELNAVANPTDDPKTVAVSFEAEPGIKLSILCDADALAATADPASRLAVLINADEDSAATFRSAYAMQLREAGWHVAAANLRATGQYANLSDKIGHAPDHNSAEWSMWIGRPLAGQWVVDVRRALDAIAKTSERDRVLPKSVAVVGIGSAGVVALCSAALDERITDAIAVNSLSSWISDSPYRGQRLGLMIPGILRDVGDVSHIAAMTAPRRVRIVGGVSGAGTAQTSEQLSETFRHAREIFNAYRVPEALRIVDHEGFSSAVQP